MSLPHPPSPLALRSRALTASCHEGPLSPDVRLQPTFADRHLPWLQSQLQHAPSYVLEAAFAPQALSSAASSADSSPPPTPVSTLPHILGSPLPVPDYRKSTDSSCASPPPQLPGVSFGSPLVAYPLNPLRTLSSASSSYQTPDPWNQPHLVSEDPAANYSLWSFHPSWIPQPESPPPRSRSRLRSRQPPQPLTPRIAILACLLISSFIIIALLVSTIPALHLPTSLALVRDQISHLRAYAASSTAHYIHLTIVLSSIFIWKQAFSIPGTVLVNILLGALYGTWISTILTSLLTALGSTLAYAMARLARPVVEKYVPKPLRAVEDAVDRFRTRDGYDTVELSSYLLLARLLPVVPYAALNLASGVLELPLGPFFWTLVIGSLPYNFLTTQVGDILSLASEKSISTIWSPDLIVKLALVSLTGALPILLKSRLRPWIAKTRRNQMTNRRKLMAKKFADLGSPTRKVASVIPSPI